MRRIALLWMIALLPLAPIAAFAQAYPAKTVRIVVPYSAGTATDNVARLLAQKLSETWRQQVVVENLAGANGIIGTEAVARAPKDGYTLAMIASNHAVNAHLYSKVPYDPIKDFAAIGMIGHTPLLLMVHPSVPANSVPGLIQLVKDNPGKLNYGSPGSGSAPHLAAELFKSMAKLDIVHVPYKGLAPALTDLLGGQVQIMFPALPAALPHARSGKLRALGVTDLARSQAAPDIPSLHEQGVSGYEVLGWIGLVGPAGTPREVVRKIHADMTAALAAPDVKTRLTSSGIEIVGGSPEQMAQTLSNDSERWGKLVRETGAKLD